MLPQPVHEESPGGAAEGAAQGLEDSEAGGLPDHASSDGSGEEEGEEDEEVDEDGSDGAEGVGEPQDMRIGIESSDNEVFIERGYTSSELEVRASG